MSTVQNAHRLLRIMIDDGLELYFDLPERSGLNREHFLHAVQYLESVGKVRLGTLPHGRLSVSLNSR
jgi:hypothetical protein